MTLGRQESNAGNPGTAGLEEKGEVICSPSPPQLTSCRIKMGHKEVTYAAGKGKFSVFWESHDLLIIRDGLGSGLLRRASVRGTYQGAFIRTKQ